MNKSQGRYNNNILYYNTMIILFYRRMFTLINLYLFLTFRGHVNETHYECNTRKILNKQWKLLISGGINEITLKPEKNK